LHRLLDMASPFERLVGTLDYPLYVVTTAIKHRPAGCLIGFATQCSIHPPRFLACISKKNHTLLLADQAAHVAVHIVAAHDKEIAKLFCGETGDEVDKFARVSWHESHGVPILDACERWFVGAVLRQIDLGDHVGFLLEPIDTGRDAGAEQLTFQQARDIDPGHAP
jgi:flavin reductase (DIM6/NTAB) family NADH-FMN oxidoreductase RutF